MFWFIGHMPKHSATEYPFRIVYEPYVNINDTILADISRNMHDISGAIDSYTTAYTDISNVYGMSGEEIELFPTTDRKDVLKQDLQYMISHQDQTYFVAIITIATLLVGTFYIVGKY